MTNSDMVQRYRHLRNIANHIQDDVIDLVQYSTILEFGRRLGIVRSGELSVENQESKLLCDLAVHTARPGRSRAIDRYARSAAFPAGSDDARVLAALQKARFTTFRIEARHPVAGAMAHDLLLKKSFHLMDISVGLTAPRNFSLIGRLLDIDGFRMSCLTLVPMNSDLLEQARPRLPASMARNALEAFQDPGCAIALYRAAVELGTMQRAVTFDVVKKVPTARSVAMIRAINDHLSEDWPALTSAR
jgi:hypothetical protein